MRRRIIVFALAAMVALPSVTFAAWYNPSTWFKKNKKVNSTTITGTVEHIIEGQVVFKTTDGQVILLLGKRAANIATVKDAKIRIFGNVHEPSDMYPKGAITVRNFKVIEDNVVIAEPKPVYTEAAPESTQETAVNTPEADNSLSDQPQTVTGTPGAEIGSELPSQNQITGYVEPTTYDEPEAYIEPIALEGESPDTTDKTSTVALSEVQHPGPYTGPIVAEESKTEKSEEAKVPSTAVMVVEDYQKYIVQPGDSLGKISSKIFGSTSRWKEIAELNKIDNPKALRVGMTLKVPIE